MKIYFNRQDAGLRKIKKFVNENHLNYEFRSITKKKPLTKEEFTEILKRTVDGIEDILSTKSPTYKKLSEQIQFEDLTINELLELINQHPQLMKSPITILDNGGLYIGYNKDDIGTILNKEKKRSRYLRILEYAHSIEGLDSEIFDKFQHMPMKQAS